MSIVVLRLGDNFAALAGDGVATDPRTGNVVAYVSKIHLVPECETMIGVTGAAGFGQLMLLHKAERVRDFDDFVDDLPRLVRKVHYDMLDRGLAGGGETLSNVMIAGWSASAGRYCGFRMTTYDKDSTNNQTGEKKTLGAFEPHPISQGGLLLSTGPDPDMLERFHAFDDAVNIEESPLDQMVRIVAAGRASNHWMEEWQNNGNIGGYVQIALYQRPDMKSWIDHRWPEDVIGKPVDPTAGQPMPERLMKHYDAPT